MQDYYFLELSYTIITLGLLYFFLRKSFTSKKNLKQEMVHWVLFGILFNLYSFSWLYTVYPLVWMNPGILQILGITVVHLTVSLTSGLCFFIVGFHTHKSVSYHARPLLFASLVTIAEILRSIALYGVMRGQDSLFTFSFTAGTLGNALSTTPFVEFAYYGGTFALTFCAGYLIYTLSTKEHLSRYMYHIFGIVIFLWVTHVYIPVHTLPENVLVGIVTTDFKEQRDENYIQAFKEQAPLTHAATLSFDTKTNIIVYPEDTRYISHLTDKMNTDLLQKFKTTLFVDGDTLPVKTGYSNISVFYTPTVKKTQGRGKEFLLPFNEYIPISFQKIINIFITGDVMEKYIHNHTYSPIYSNKTIEHNKLKIGTLLCSEVLSFSVIQELRSENPDIIFFQSRLNVFHNNPWFIMHLRSFTKVAGAQTRTTIISTTNNAPSFIISPYGTIIHFTPTGFSTSTYQTTTDR